MIFSICTELYNYPHHLVWERFLSPPKETSSSFVVMPCPHHQPQATTNLFSVLIDLPILDISYKWNQTVCGDLCLASFTRHFEVHLCCSVYLHIYCWILFHRVDIPCVIHLPADGHLHCVHFWVVIHNSQPLHEWVRFLTELSLFLPQV